MKPGDRRGGIDVVPSRRDDHHGAGDDGEGRHQGDDRPGYSAALATIVVLALLVGAGWWYAHRQAVGRIPRGTSVAGVEIGGMSHAEAVAALRAGLADRVAAPITLVVGDRRVEVTPAAAGLQVDYSASVDRATVSRSWDPTRLWNYYTAGGDLQPVVSVDPVKLRTEVTGLAQQLGRPGRDAGVRFQGGRVQLVRATDGQGLAVEAVSSALMHAYLSDDSVGQVVLTSVAPAIGDQAVQRAVTRLVNPALTSPVTLTFAGSRVVLRPPTFEAALTLVAHDGVLRLGVDRDRLMSLVGAAVRRASTPVDATVRLVHGTPRVIAGRRGVTFQPDAIVRAFLSVLGRTDRRRHVAVPTVVSPPTFSTSDARALQIVHPVAKVTTRFTSSQESYTALAHQAAEVDGTVLRPHEIFSLAGAVPGGGDLTQVATTLYNAAFYAGLRDVEHSPPTPHVARFPLGREATVRPGGPDLQFQNSTPYGVLIQVGVSRGSLTATLWSSSTWHVTSTTSCERSPGSTAYEVVTSRIFSKPGSSAVDHVEKVYTNYPTLSPAVCAAAG